MSPSACTAPRGISHQESRRWRSPASGRCRTCPRRTTGSGATWWFTSGSRSGSAGFESPISPAARDTAPTVLARTAAEVVGVDANPEAHEHARLRYRRHNLRFERGLVEEFAGPCDAIVFLQTIEHVAEPGRLLERLAAAAPLAYITTPNRLTLAPPGAQKSDNPWHLREYTLAEYRGAAGAPLLEGRDARRLSRPQAARPRAGPAARLGQGPPRASPHEALLRPLRPGDLLRRLRGRLRRATSRAPSTSWPSAMPERDVGDLAVVLHSHMPYVEGFGTYPFGEEWLFDAVGRSYLPVLEQAHDLTVTVTPVLADQLEAPGVAERLRSFLRRYRLEAAEREAAERRSRAASGGARRRPSATAAPLTVWRRSAASRCEAFRSRGARAQCRPDPVRGHPRRAAADRHRRWAGACRSTPGCARTGGDSARRRDSGFPSAPTARESSRCSPSGACGSSAPTRARKSPALDSLAPARARAGLVAFTLDWEAVELVWSPRRLPVRPGLRRFHRLSMGGMRLWSIGGGPYDPAAARARRREHAAEFADSVAAAARGISRAGAASPGWSPSRSTPSCWPLVVGGPDLARGRAAVGRRARRPAGHPPRGPGAPPAGGAAVGESSWGEGKDLRTWDAPEVADLAWAARRLELRLLAAVSAGRSGRRRPSARRASCSRCRRATGRSWTGAGRRATTRSGARRPCAGAARSHTLREPPDPRMRNLAPDLSLVPLREP